MDGAHELVWRAGEGGEGIACLFAFEVATSEAGESVGVAAGDEDLDGRQAFAFDGPFVEAVDTRFELASLERSVATLFAVKPTETGKLTLALGKLIVKRAALETEASRLTRSYNADHPELKRAKRRVEIFDNAIKEVLR